MEIHFLKQHALEKAKWDACIDRAVNGLPYAYSWYLDRMAPGWHALVGGDYEAVMPLPWNAKLFGFPQIYQPFFCQQLGIFSSHPVTPDLTGHFLDHIPSRFRRVVLHLNEQNPVPASRASAVSSRTNMLLDLNRPFPEIRAGYSKSLRKRIRQASEALHLVEAPLSPAALVQQYTLELQEKVTLPKGAYRRFTTVMEAAIERSKGQIWGAATPDGKLAAAGFFLLSHHRIINLFGASTPLGKQSHGMHFLLDALIQKWAGQPWTFDFEGSSIPSIAYFFGSFGAEKKTYWQFKRGW